MTALHCAALLGDVTMASVLIDKCGADPNAPMSKGTAGLRSRMAAPTALHIAAMAQHAEMVGYLCSLASTDINLMAFVPDGLGDVLLPQGFNHTTNGCFRACIPHPPFFCFSETVCSVTVSPKPRGPSHAAFKPRTRHPL